MKGLKRMGGVLPAALFAAADTAVWVVQTRTGLHIRSVPRGILTYGTAVSLCVFLIWLWCRVRRGERRALCILHGCLTAGLVLAVLFFALFSAGFNCVPEFTAEVGDKTYLIRHTEWLDTVDEYYEYKGKIFFGEYAGWAESGAEPRWSR